MKIDEGGSASNSTDPVATLSTTESEKLDEGLIVNGTIDIRKTHPTLYRLVMSIALIQIALGLNFLVGKDVLGLTSFQPAFFVWDMPNELWAAFFLAIGLGKIVFLNFYRSLRLTRAIMAFAVAFLLFFAVGTMQPAFEGNGSLQLPILYGGIVALNVWLLLEPFINPWTAKR